MNKVITGCFLVAALAVPSYVMADTSDATLTVTGTVVSSISLTIESAGGTTGTLGTNAATSTLGSISKFGALPLSFTRTTTGTSWTIASSIGVKVLQANSTSANYTLNAKLLTAPDAGVTWTVQAVLLNATTPQALYANGVYGVTPTVISWSIGILDSITTATAIGNTIELSAVAG